MIDKNNVDKHQRGIFGGILLIGIGIVLLLNNFGLLSWNIWSVLWRFWPLILIMGGLETLFGRNMVAEIILELIIFLFIAYIVIISVATNNSSFRLWIEKHIKWLPLNQQFFYHPVRPRFERYL